MCKIFCSVRPTGVFSLAHIYHPPPHCCASPNGRNCPSPACGLSVSFCYSWDCRLAARVPGFESCHCLSCMSRASYSASLSLSLFVNGNNNSAYQWGVLWRLDEVIYLRYCAQQIVRCDILLLIFLPSTVTGLLASPHIHSLVPWSRNFQGKLGNTE